MNLSSLLIHITAAVFAFYGLGFVFAPVEMSSWATDTAPTTGAGLADMRATYGGMSLGVAIILFTLAARPTTIRQGLVAVLALMLAMAAGRGVGLVADAPVNTLMIIYFVVELVAAAAAALLLRRGSAA